LSDTPLRVVAQCERNLRNPRASRRALGATRQAECRRPFTAANHLDVAPTQCARAQSAPGGEFRRKPDRQAFARSPFAGRVLALAIGKQSFSQSIAVSVEKRFESRPIHEFDPHSNDHWTAALRSRTARSRPTSSAREMAALPIATISVAGT
jgi:hypothetical protein